MVNLSDSELERFKREVFLNSGQNLENYKHHQLNRRILELMKRAGFQTLLPFSQYLSQDPDLMQQFLDDLTINVSEFFRNPERFQELKIWLQDMGKQRLRLKIWSAGCSIGAEIYSLVIMLANLDLIDRCTFLASDIDQRVIKQAKEGIYHRNTLLHVSKADLNYYFEQIQQNGRYDSYQLKEEWRQKVQFIQHDLLVDTYPRSFDLIVCRNVMIYFNKKAKEQVNLQFYDVLRDKGLLFIGSAEESLQFKQMGYSRLSSFIYQKQSQRPAL